MTHQQSDRSPEKYKQITFKFLLCSQLSGSFGGDIEIIVRQIALRGSPLQVPQKRFEKVEPPTNEQHFKMKRINFFGQIFNIEIFFSPDYFSICVSKFFCRRSTNELYLSGCILEHTRQSWDEPGLRVKSPGSKVRLVLIKAPTSQKAL